MSTEHKPLIGFTTYGENARMLVWETDFAMLQRTYVDAMSRAGGVPVLLPPSEGGEERVLDAVSALVLTGGADIDPSCYGERSHEQTRATRPDRDAWEVALCRRALDRGMPVLGVCRGMQMLNVALGGSLVQHLPDVVASDYHRPEPGVFGSVHVRLQEGSRIAGLLGTENDVRCSHHQAVDRLADDLRAVGWADDGVVEAVELSGRGFALGVQWHPEEDKADVRLFEALVRAADPRPHVGDGGRAARVGSVGARVREG